MGLGKTVTTVTPYVGVWIETLSALNSLRTGGVTPYVGVWIETPNTRSGRGKKPVTPYVGVWIETLTAVSSSNTRTSHPTWVCGLKRRWSTT